LGGYMHLKQIDAHRLVMNTCLNNFFVKNIG
jgi:hypothetical protein